MTNIFLVINLMKLFKNKKCKKLTDGGHQVMAKSHALWPVEVKNKLNLP